MKKKKWKQYIGMVLCVLVGAVCGFYIVSYAESTAMAGKSFGEVLLSLAVMFIGIYVGIFLQLVIHEAGHLVFGLATGYKFSSFRIGSFMWIKENGRLRLKRFMLAGTGGQCLMEPPEMEGGKFPVVLYNLGGSILNFAAGLLLLWLHFLLKAFPLFSAVMLFAALIGFLLAIMNGVPMRTGMVDNDGYNALALGKNGKALHAFWLQLKMNEQISKGVRLREMPEEWFEVPADEELKNSMLAAKAVFACNRLMDEHRFEDADRLMAHLLEADSSIIGLHRNLLVCDRIYCQLIGENQEIDKFLTKGQKKFMKSMKKFLSVLRTEYVCALFAGEDTSRIKAMFEKCAKSYPYPGEIQGEWELIQIAEKIKGGS